MKRLFPINMSTGCSSAHSPSRKRTTGSLRVLHIGHISCCLALGIWSGAAEELKSATNVLDMSLEELGKVKVASVYGASKYEQKITDAPASVSLVTSDEIKKFGYRTLADVLQSVRGLFLSSDRNYSYLGIRGFLRPGDYNMRVLVLVDGHRMNENIFDSAYFGHENIVDVDAIDRVEIIRGPSSSIYGSSAFFGVINVVTKQGHQLDGVEVSGEAGAFNSYKGRISYGKKFENDVEWYFLGSYYTSEGQRWLYYPEFDQRISADPRANNNGLAKNSDGEEAGNFRTRLSYHDFSLEGFYNVRYKKVPTASFNTVFNDGREETMDQRAYVDLKYDHAFNEDCKLLGRAYFDDYQYEGTYPTSYNLTSAVPAVVLNKDVDLGRWAGTEWQLGTAIFEKHRLILGAEYRENIDQAQANYDDLSPRVYYLNVNPSSRILAFYGQAEVALMTNLLLNAGARYDHYFQSFGGTANPRVGLLYSPWRAGTFKLLYGQAFRAPNSYELYYDSPSNNGNPGLKPETIRTYEAVYEHYLGLHYRFSLSGYYYQVKDLINQVTDSNGTFTFRNLNQVEAKGLELEAEANYANGWLARVSYALQRTEDADTGAELSNSPRHLAKFNLIAPLYRDKLFAGGEIQYHSMVKTLANRKTDDFTLVNLTLFSQKWLKGLEASASVYNLFDTQYGYPGAGDHLQDIIMQDGRSFRVKLTYRF